MLATAHLRSGALAHAAAIASELRETESAPAAHQILGQVAHVRGDRNGAFAHLFAAVGGFRMRWDDRGLARAAYTLAGIAKEYGLYGLALDAQTIARSSAAGTGDRRMMMYADLATAIILRATGDETAAEGAMERALEVASSPYDRAWVLLTQGLAYADMGLDALAISSLQNVIALTDNRDLHGAARLNLAFLAQRANDYAAALEHIVAAEQNGGDRLNVALLRGQVAVGRGEHEAAAKLLREAASLDPQERWSWQVPLWRGINEESRGDNARAERFYREAITATEALRAGTGRLEAHVTAKYREAYERLIGLLARARRSQDALQVIARLDAWATPARGITGADAESLLAAWRDRELVVVVRGGDHAWRLEVRGGRVEGVDLGDAAKLERAAERFVATPGDAALARQLGEALLGPQRGGGPLYVLLIGGTATVPLAALRVGDALAITRRPLVRVLGLTAGRPGLAPARPGGIASSSGAPGTTTADDVIVGDPRGDLPAAATEARAVAAALGTTARIGAAATRAAIANARGRLLHVAAHADHTPDGPVLMLADGAITPAEVATLGATPRVVVLASCGSASARDQGGWGSLAAAFLAAGSDLVIATSWAVGDAAASAVIRELYPEAAVDPVRALARVQSKLATADSGVAIRDWSAFTVIAAPPRE